MKNALFAGAALAIFLINGCSPSPIQVPVAPAPVAQFTTPAYKAENHYFFGKIENKTVRVRMFSDNQEGFNNSLAALKARGYEERQENAIAPDYTVEFLWTVAKEGGFYASSVAAPSKGDRYAVDCLGISDGPFVTAGYVLGLLEEKVYADIKDYSKPCSTGS